jgi:hypothetical protein
MLRILQQMGTAGVIGVVGDSFMQFKEGNTSFDYMRSCRLAVFRMAQAPLVDLMWQGFDKIITIKGPAGTLAMVAADQIFIAPPSIVAFYYCQSWMEGRSELERRERVLTMWLPTYSVCLPFWCCAHSITFSGLIPSNFRIAWASLCGVGWNAYMSGANQQTKDAAKMTGS